MIAARSGSRSESATRSSPASCWCPASARPANRFPARSTCSARTAIPTWAKAPPTRAPSSMSARGNRRSRSRRNNQRQKKTPPTNTGGVIQTSAASRRRLHAIAVGIDTIAGRVDPGAILRHAIGRSALIDRGALIDRSALIGGHAADFALAIDAGIHFTIDARVVAHGAGLQAVGRAGIAGIAVQAGFGIVAVDAAHLAGAALARHAA